MNFLDTYDIARAPTPNPDQQAEQPSLNEEVTQVIGQLGRFWGGFRKQSQQALDTARKDFSQVVVQAQKELNKLTVAEPTVGSAAEARDSQPATEETNSEPSGATPSVEGSSASTSTPEDTPSDKNEGTTTQTLFSRLQASLPPNIVSTVQSNIPDSLKHVSENIDLSQMRSKLLSDFQHVQGVTRAQAEEYLHKSEAVLRDVVKEAGDVLRDAVKVVPPEEAAPSGGMLWDGTDMWMLPYDAGARAAAGTSGSSSRGSQGQAAAAVATRAEALLKRLKHDPSILKHDPEVEQGIKDSFISWRGREVDTKEGGIEGSEWNAKITAALEDPTDGQTLKQLEESLVPAEMSKSAFWQRFFFRSHQIRSEEEKRKALILSTTENDEDFSWEDDEDESSPNAGSKALSEQSAEKLKGGIPPSAALLSPDGPPSRRVNSEDSFDLVSAASANVSVAGDAEKVAKPKPDEDEDGDSDWE